MTTPPVPPHPSVAANVADGIVTVETQASRLPLYGWIALGVVVVVVLGYCKGRSDGVSSVKIAEATQVVKVADQARAAATETVYVAAKATAVAQATKQTVDTKLPILAALPTPQVTPSAMTHDTIFVPRIVIQRIAADSVLIIAQRRELLSLALMVRVDSQTIMARDRLIQQFTPGRCGTKCGATLGVLGTFLVLKVVHARL